MKQSKLFLTAILLVSAFVFQPNLASAVVGSATPVEASATVAAPEMTKKQNRKIERLERRFEKMAKKHSMVDEISLEDSPRQWLIRWVACWGLGVLFSIFAAATLWPLIYVASIFFLLGSICFVIWILKLLGAI